MARVKKDLHMPCWTRSRITLNMVDAKGSDVTMRLSTMSCSSEVIRTTKIKDLTVRGFFTNKRINLPPAFTRPAISVDRDQIPTPEVTRQWQYLKKNAEDIAPLHNVEISLLIGSTEAIATRNFVPPENGGSYTQQTALGWDGKSWQHKESIRRVCNMPPDNVEPSRNAIELFHYSEFNIRERSASARTYR